MKFWYIYPADFSTGVYQCINMIICILINPKILVFHKFSMYFFICSHYVQWKGLRSSFGEFILLNLWWDFLVKIHTTVSWLTYDPFCWLHEKYFKVRRINGKDLEGNLIHAYGGHCTLLLHPKFRIFDLELKPS